MAEQLEVRSEGIERAAALLVEARKRLDQIYCLMTSTEGLVHDASVAIRHTRFIAVPVGEECADAEPKV